MRKFANQQCLKLCLGSMLLGIALCSCRTVRYDMRNLEQPVMMNSNPFLGEQDTRPALKPVDKYSSLTFATHDVKAYTTYSRVYKVYNTEMIHQDFEGNVAEVNAFEKIGGDPLLTITNVRLDTESICLNGLVFFGFHTKIQATGEVQKINQPTYSGEENVK